MLYIRRYEVSTCAAFGNLWYKVNNRLEQPVANSYIYVRRLWEAKKKTRQSHADLVFYPRTGIDKHGRWVGIAHGLLMLVKRTLVNA